MPSDHSQMPPGVQIGVSAWTFTKDDDSYSGTAIRPQTQQLPTAQRTCAEV